MSASRRHEVFEAYNIANWSDGYVDVDEQGDVLIRPHRDQSRESVKLTELVTTLEQQGMALPVLVRFADILHDRLNRLCGAFNQAAERDGYRGGYTAVYPIKVNQQRRVVEEIQHAEPAATSGQLGLEAGSKPELMAVLALSRTPGSVIVCNGYKDREYIRTALLGRRMGHRVYIVVEKQSELPLILAQARELGVQPLIGVRARLASIGKGNWQNTGGEKSKFGLSARQIMDVMQTLEKEGAMDSLQMVHFHLGSQIANIRDIQTGLRECARFYTELYRAGAPINTLDIGGGLGVDYEGTRSRSACSINYSLDEYAWHVVHTLREECDAADVPHPNIISESGRAMTAHHAVLITNVIDREVPAARKPDAVDDQAPIPLKDLWRDYQALGNGDRERSLIEVYHDAVHAISEVHAMFAHGNLSLAQRAQAEDLYMATCLQLRDALRPENRLHRDILDELNEKLAEKLFVNFSLFQSLPDIWGIDQIFPILPVSGLNQPLSRRGVIQDITCDSDGRVDHYVHGGGIETTLPLPPHPQEGRLLLGFFMTGAYQEILGDMHNLFGDTNSVDVFMDATGHYRIEHPLVGDTVAELLNYVHYESDALLESYREQLAASDIDSDEQARILNELTEGLAGYTYLED
ncbi:biosynthetic arginine decarboxylase [Marinobacteraceae bacterium S3BR75-40.1]